MEPEKHNVAKDFWDKLAPEKIQRAIEDRDRELYKRYYEFHRNKKNLTQDELFTTMNDYLMYNPNAEWIKIIRQYILRDIHDIEKRALLDIIAELAKKLEDMGFHPWTDHNHDEVNVYVKNIHYLADPKS